MKEARNDEEIISIKWEPEKNYDRARLKVERFLQGTNAESIDIRLAVTSELGECMPIPPELTIILKNDMGEYLYYSGSRITKKGERVLKDGADRINGKMQGILCISGYYKNV